MFNENRLEIVNDKEVRGRGGGRTRKIFISNDNILIFGIYNINFSDGNKCDAVIFNSIQLFFFLLIIRIHVKTYANRSSHPKSLQNAHRNVN